MGSLETSSFRFILITVKNMSISQNRKAAMLFFTVGRFCKMLMFGYHS